jgi:hypothetical protein
MPALRDFFSYARCTWPYGYGSRACLLQALPLLAEDSQSIENLLQSYALHEIFLGRPTAQFKQRLNKTLNVQWALDIAVSFSSGAVTERFSDNLEDWLYEVEDEDDRHQIELWAKQVQKGRITEEQFRAHLKALP